MRLPEPDPKRPSAMDWIGAIALTIFASAFMGVIVGMAVLWVNELMSWNLSWFECYGIAYAISFPFYAVDSGYSLFDDYRTWSVHQRKTCQHGVEGGETQKKCLDCLKAFEQQRLEAERQHREAELRLAISSEARKLAAQESKRLASHLLGTREYLVSLSPRDFEDIVIQMYRRLGYKAQGTKMSNDMGRDGFVSKDGETFVIECKRYAVDKRIGRPPLQKLFAAVTEERANGGILVTTAEFTATAITYSRKYNIELVNGQRLALLMNKAFPDKSDANIMRVMCQDCGEILELPFPNSLHAISCGKMHTIQISGSLQDISVKPLTGKKYCEKCGKELRVVNGWRGKFWGCTGYPQCRFTQRYNEASWIR